MGVTGVTVGVTNYASSASSPAVRRRARLPSPRFDSRAARHRAAAGYDTRARGEEGGTPAYARESAWQLDPVTNSGQG